MNEEERKEISQAIIEGLTCNVEEFYLETGLTHRNGQHMLRWDYIYTNIAKNLMNSNLKLVKIYRGIFTFDLIVNEEEKVIYSVIKEKNLSVIKRNRNSNHYMWALASINKNIEQKLKQLSLFAIDNIDEKFYDEVIGQIGFIPENYQTILIDDLNKKFPVVYLCQLDKDLNEVSRTLIGKNSFVEYEFNNINVDRKEEAKVEIKLKQKARDKVEVRIRKEKDEKISI